MQAWGWLVAWGVVRCARSGRCHLTGTPARNATKSMADAFKRFACPTIEEAKASFIARKKRAISIYRSRLRQAEEALTVVQAPIPPQELEKRTHFGDYLFPLRPVPAY